MKADGLAQAQKREDIERFWSLPLDDLIKRLEPGGLGGLGFLH